ncbi:MAG: hypothetical protein ACO32I_08835, partial [Candidatus Limnocylindrus sp.]
MERLLAAPAGPEVIDASGANSALAQLELERQEGARTQPQSPAPPLLPPRDRLEAVAAKVQHAIASQTRSWEGVPDVQEVSRQMKQTSNELEALARQLVEQHGNISVASASEACDLAGARRMCEAWAARHDSCMSRTDECHDELHQAMAECTASLCRSAFDATANQAASLRLKRAMASCADAMKSELVQSGKAVNDFMVSVAPTLARAAHESARSVAAHASRLETRLDELASWREAAKILGRADQSDSDAFAKLVVELRRPHLEYVPQRMESVEGTRAALVEAQRKVRESSDGDVTEAREARDAARRAHIGALERALAETLSAGGWTSDGEFNNACDASRSAVSALRI